MKRAIAVLALLFAVVVPPSPAHATNCVAYVKSATGFNLYGDAWQWWGAASNLYGRGYSPAPGAVMVFSRTSRMHVGHVAVVHQVMNSREITVDQANWHRGRIDHGVSIRDLSPDNDWSSVEVEWTPGVYGGPFPITGFVYAPGTPLSNGAGEQLADRDSGPRFVEAARPAHGHVVLAGGRSLAARHATLKAARVPAKKAAPVPASWHRAF